MDALEEEVKKDGVGDITELSRPSLVGWTPTVAAVHDLTGQVTALRIESNPTKAQFAKGPKFPMEIVEDRLRNFASRKRMSAIEASQARHGDRRRKTSA